MYTCNYILPLPISKCCHTYKKINIYIFNLEPCHMYSIPFKFKKGKRNVLYTAQQTAFRNHQESKTTKFNDMLYYLFFP